MNVYCTAKNDLDGKDYEGSVEIGDKSYGFSVVKFDERRYRFALSDGFIPQEHEMPLMCVGFEPTYDGGMLTDRGWTGIKEACEKLGIALGLIELVNSADVSQKTRDLMEEIKSWSGEGWSMINLMLGAFPDANEKLLKCAMEFEPTQKMDVF